jgi:hypothetical protein
VPDLLVDNIITDGTPEPCSPNDPNAELTALLGIRTGMQQMLGQQVMLIKSVWLIGVSLIQSKNKPEPCFLDNTNDKPFMASQLECS